MDRRHFLRTGLAGISLPALVACGADDPGALQSSTETGPTVRPAEEVNALIAQNAFPWGVASGDPTAHELILWTAIAPANENVVSVPLILEYVLVQGQADRIGHHCVARP